MSIDLLFSSNSQVNQTRSQNYLPFLLHASIIFKVQSSNMSSKPIIAVIGGIGAQGTSVIQGFCTKELPPADADY